MWRRLVQLPLQITFLDVTPGAEERGEEGGLGIPDGTTSKPPRLRLALFIHHQEKGGGGSKPGRELVFCQERNLDLGCAAHACSLPVRNL